MSTAKHKLAYVVGENYKGLSRLPGIVTAAQFLQQVLDGSLPSQVTWMMGQGLSNAEKSLLQLCQAQCREICFYNAKENHLALSLQKHSPRKVFVTISRWLSSFLPSVFR